MNPLRKAAASMYSAATRVVGGIWTRWGGQGWGRLRLLLPSARFDWEREAGDPWRNSVVALGLAWLGDRFPRPPIRLSKIARNGDYVPQARSAAIDLWNRPNAHYGRRTLEKAVGLSLKVDGNAYVYKVRDRLDRVRELWWLPHYCVHPTWPDDGSEFIDGYRIWIDTIQYWLPASEIIHIRDGIDPRNDRLGMAPLKSCLREVCTINFESGYTAALLKNSGVPGLAIVPDGDSPTRPNEDAARAIKEGFIERLSGDRVGEPLIMAGRYKIVEIGFSPEKLALKDLPRNSEARIGGAIGVAAMSLGLPDPNKTYSNLGEANRASWGAIVSIQQLIADELRWQLLPEPIVAPSGLMSPGLDSYQFCLEYDYSEVQELQESLDAVHARVREDFKVMLITKNEARELLGFEPAIDPTGDTWYTLPSQTITTDNLDVRDATANPSAPNAPAGDTGKQLAALASRNGWQP